MIVRKSYILYHSTKGEITIPNKKKFYELERLMRNSDTGIKTFYHLAEALNVHRVILSNIYTLNRRLDVVLAFEICKLFNCKFEDLITERYINLLKKSKISETESRKTVGNNRKGVKKNKLYMKKKDKKALIF